MKTDSVPQTIPQALLAPLPPHDKPWASIVLICYNGHQFIDNCLRSVLESDYPYFDVIFVDNASTDDSVEMVERYGDRVALLKNPENYLSSKGLNQGIRYARGEVVVLLDLDTVVRKDWLRKLLEPLEADSRVGITGSKLYFGDESTLQHAGGNIHWNAHTSHSGHGEKDQGQWEGTREVDYVTGASIAIRKTLLDKLGGGLDEMFPFYYEEVDVCWQAHVLGWKVLYVSDSVAIHYESATMRQGSYRYLYNFHRGRCRFMLKNHPVRELVTKNIAAEIRWLFQSAIPHGMWRAVFPAYWGALTAPPTALQRRRARRIAFRAASSPVAVAAHAESQVGSRGDAS